DNPSRSPLVTIPPEDHTWLHYVVKGFKDLFAKNFYDEAWRFRESWRKKRRNASADEFAAVRQRIDIDKHLTSQILSSYQEQLDLFIYICRLYKIEPVLMTQENRLTDSPDPAVLEGLKAYDTKFGIRYTQYKQLYDSMNDLVRTAGKEKGV